MPECALAVRITAKEDLTLPSTKAALHGLIQFCSRHDIEAHLWVSVPCTAGCPWSFVNAARGVQTGDPYLTRRLVAAAVELCDHAEKSMFSFSWEWPDRSQLWKLPQVVELISRRGR